MTQRFGVAILCAVMVVFAVVLALWAVALLQVGTPLSIAVAVGLFLLDLFGLFAAVLEVRFGIQSGRLGRLMESEGALPADSVGRMPSGRIPRSEGDRIFARYAEAVEQDPGDWHRWFTLGLAYDAAGDRRRARWAVRQAIQVERGGAA